MTCHHQASPYMQTRLLNPADPMASSAILPRTPRPCSLRPCSTQARPSMPSTQTQQSVAGFMPAPAACQTRTAASVAARPCSAPYTHVQSQDSRPAYLANLSAQCTRQLRPAPDYSLPSHVFTSRLHLTSACHVPLPDFQPTCTLGLPIVPAGTCAPITYKKQPFTG